ncbi:MAG: O-antigen ligase family protein [Sphingomonadaceae bacterium]
MGAYLQGLGSFAGGMAFALGGAVLLIAGFGLGLTLEGRYRRWVLPALAALITLAPPAGVLLSGRNLADIDFMVGMDAGGLSAWLLRLSTASIVGIALVRIIGRLFRSQTGQARSATAATVEAAHTGLPLFLGFGAYYVGNVLLPAAFGTVPSFAVQMLYPLAVVGAIYMSRHYEPSDWLDAVKWSLLAFLVVSLLASAIDSGLTTQYGSRETRLPGMTYRYWGLGSNPNSIAPLALLLMLLSIHRPFRYKLLTFLALALGALVLLLAQSQTTWGAAALVLAPFTVYCLRHRHGAPAAEQGWTPMRLVVLAGMLLAVAFAAALLIVELRVGSGVRNDFASALEASRKSQDISELSGRTQIWLIALDVWKQSPLFGYGPTLWSDTFRATWRVPFAFHAHNQFMQSLGAAGIVGVLGLLAYVGALVVGALRAARTSRGLAPALVAVMLVRMVTEVPLELSTVLLGDFLFQLTTFVAVLGYLLRAERRRLAPAAPRRRSSGSGSGRRRRSSAWRSSSSGSPASSSRRGHRHADGEMAT